MKVKYTLVSLIMLVAIVVVYIAVLTHARSINTTIRGVNFQLGTEHIDNVQPEAVSIKGSLSRSLNGLRTFKGSITFEHDTIPIPKENRDTTIHFDKNGYGPIVYGYIRFRNKRCPTKNFFQRCFISNSDFSSITYLQLSLGGMQHTIA